MAFGGGAGGHRSIFEDDPFFSGFPAFPGMGFPRHTALNNGSSGQLTHRRDPFSSMWPFGGEDPFARMHSMMAGTMQGMESNPNSHCFSSSSVMHYSSSGDGRQPRVYQATSTSRQTGGIKETRRSVRDSESGMHKMAIGHHINDRSHTIERRINTKTNDKEEHQEYINIDETDAQPFDQEWQERSRHTRLRPLHHSRALPSPDVPTKRDHTHKHHHPYQIPQHHRRHTDDLEPGPSPVHGRGLLGESSRKHADPLVREEKRHKNTKREKKKVQF